MLPLNYKGDKCQIYVCGPIPLWTSWEHTLVFEFIKKTSDSIQSKLYEWHNIVDLNMNKRISCWNIQKNHLY